MALAAGTATVCAQFQQTATRHPDGPALTTLDGPALTWDAYAKQVRLTAAALAGLGLARGDVVACWLANRPEFHVADAAAMHLGITTVSVYNRSSTWQAEHVLHDSGARLLVTEAAYVDAAIAIRDGGRTTIEHIVLVEGDAPQALGWDELLEFAECDFDFDAAWQSVQAEDLATLIYTPGTTGPPKGVRLSHANLTTQTQALINRLGLPDPIRVLSFLPLAHIAERLSAHYLPMAAGWQVTCCPGVRVLADGLAATRPGMVMAPTRVWETLRSALGPNGSAVDLGLDGLEAALVGGAPCPRALLDFWHSRGVPLTEVYGLTEASGAVTIGGTPLEGCELRVADDGEILVRGLGVMLGYRSGPAAIDVEGWLHTGDRGALDEDGTLEVVDDLAAVEAELVSGSQLVGHACVLGGDRPYPVALLTLAPDAARAYARARGIRYADLALLARSRRVLEAVQAEVAAVNARLPHDVRIGRFLVLDHTWTDELTPTLRVRRELIEERYREELRALYDGMLGIDP